jgi:hypothetical protein
MSMSIRRLFLGVAGLALAASVAPAAWAGCGPEMVKAPASYQPTPASQANPLLTQVALPATTPTIPGLYSVTFRAGGATIDFGYVEWHSDGTELMFSGGRAPATGDVCLGAWKQTGPSTYQLTHFALGYDTSGVLNSKVTIKETVTLGPLGNYTGPFTFDVFDPKTGTLLQHIAGTVFATRVIP